MPGSTVATISGFGRTRLREKGTDDVQTHLRKKKLIISNELGHGGLLPLTPVGDADPVDGHKSEKEGGKVEGEHLAKLHAATKNVRTLKSGTKRMGKNEPVDAVRLKVRASAEMT